MYSSNVVKAPKMMDDHPDPVLPAVCSTSRRCPGQKRAVVLVVTGIATKNRDLNAINEIRLIIQQQKTYIHSYTYICICIYIHTYVEI